LPDTSHHNESEIRRYLLGELAETEQMALEDDFLTDPKLFTRVAEAENDLVDDYVRDRLAGAECARFERYYLAHPNRRQRMAAAQALLIRANEAAQATAAVTSTPETRWSNWLQALSVLRLAFGLAKTAITIAVRRRAAAQMNAEFTLAPEPNLGPTWSDRVRAVRIPRLAFSLTVAVIIILSGWAARTFRLQQENARLRAEKTAETERVHSLQRQLEAQRQRTNELTAELDSLRQPQPAASVPANIPGLATLLLDTLRLRGGQGSQNELPRLVLRADTQQVQIVLKMREGNYSAYSAVLTTATDAPVRTWQRLRPRINGSIATFTFSLPTAGLAAGEYLLILNGITATGDAEPLRRQPFRVEKP